MKEMILTVLGCIGAAIAGIFGGWSAGLTTLLIFMGIDYLTGLTVDGVVGRDTWVKLLTNK